MLSHFADHAVFTSPVAAQPLPDTAGQLRGKDAIRQYWTLSLERIPDLHFEIVNVYTGLDVIVINYSNPVGGLVNEILHINDAGLVTHRAGTYLVVDAAASSGA